MKRMILYPKLPDTRSVEKIFWNRLGYEKNALIRTPVRECAKVAIKKALEFSQSIAIVKGASVIDISDTTITARDIKIKSKCWSCFSTRTTGQLRIEVFALTLGRALDHEISNSRKKSLSQAYFLYEAGSAVIESVADQIEAKIQKIPELQYLKPSRRFSPGYCDIPLSVQNEFYSFLAPEKIGIQLTSSGAMTPEKSITAASLYAEGLPYESPCPLCNNHRCEYRREYKNR